MRLDSPRTLATRLLACLIGSVVLALMWGPQEGSSSDYYYEIKKSLVDSRIVIFLGLGVLAFLAITFWPRITPYFGRPGVVPLASGLVAVVAGLALMKWYDGINVPGDGKFGTVGDAVSADDRVSVITSAFFAWMGWASLVVVIVLCGIGIVLNIKAAAWAAMAISVFAAFAAWYSHSDVVDIAGGIDHSLGYGAATVGYLVLAFAGAIIAMSAGDVARSREFVNRAMGWRPGAPIVVVGAVVLLLAFLIGRWFAPQHYNTTLSETADLFDPANLAPYAQSYLDWLAWVLFLVCAGLAGAGVYLRSRPLAWLGALAGTAATVYTLMALYEVSDLAARVSAADGATWQNLGTGGWLACAGFLLIGGGAFVAATAKRPDADTATAPAVASASTSFLAAPGATRTAIIAALAFALFYPPTATSFWQQVLVSEIGIYVLLAVGLNVVVGWAGLLDLGFIAFFAIGSYTTAYLTGSLPIDPPSWLVLSPLLAVPFAILVCLLAGLLLGAPTLRLRGDYLAIVTLGFGEIVRLVAQNSDGITNGTRGTAVDPGRGVGNVPHPKLEIGPLKVTWGINQLQYWYLLLFFIIVVVVLFQRLEHSRLGRAWAAIREDEVAAQANGMNTYRVKLLAFAIGASTSGIAGVFFSSQIGYFTPDNFVLNNSILVVAYVVFGGMGSLPGAIAGAAILTWLPEFLQDQVPEPDRQMWIGAIVLLMMIFRPAGLIRSRRRRIELEGDDSHAEPVAVAAGGGL